MPDRRLTRSRRAGAWGVLQAAFLVLLLATGPGAFAQAASASDGKAAQPIAEDPALEARVMAVAEELRCLVCQNETIAASHADLAVDLRKQIRIKLREGQSPQQILDFMVARYGDFVLYRPRLQGTTLLLWGGPFALLLVAGTALALNIRRRRQAESSADLSAAEHARARQLLEEGPASR